jgi:tetratricopeptide (TPR) repeat protein
LSYAYQATFDLEKTLKSLEQAAKLAPEDALIQARLAELELSRGELERALKAARKAMVLDPELARTQTVLGFAYLTQIRTVQAKAAFERAITLDSADPLPRLGLGLAKIRESNLTEGAREIEIAASLDPNNALIRSYLGKAYYEEKREGLAAREFAIAKELDPKDPTPWFYDAIHKQSVNQSVEALQDLQKAIELNDNRAVYRSRLLLDQDLAARSTSLGRIYRDLGFEQHALVEGWKSLTVDPANHSAHRLLADSYSALPRHGIARVSEFLQSQLLQPINLTPVQPQLAERDLLILEGVGPADPAFNEFNPFFVRDRFALQASGIVGTQNTFGDEVVQSGVWRNLSYSLGQFHYETDGFRENNDLERDIYNAFFQANMSPKTSVQAELRHTDTKGGDRRFRFLPDTVDFTLRTALKTDTARLGFHYVFTPSSDIIASFIYKSTDIKSQEGTDVRVEETLDENAYLFEGQHLFRSQYLNLISGLGYYTTVNRRDEVTVVVRDMPFFEEVIEDNIRRTNLYLYSQINYLTDISMTLGVSADFFEEIVGARNQVNPKFGLSWSPFPGTMLRAAAYRVLEPGLSTAQTIEPTHVAGFNQYFGAIREELPITGFFSGIRAWRYGVGIDQKFSPNFSGGGELSKRDLQVPGEVNGEPREEDWEEYLARTYFHWTPHPWLAASLEYQFERFERGNLFGAGTGIGEVDTHRVPVGIRIFHPSGLSAGINATYINQEGEFARAVFDRFRPFESGAQQFWVVDAELQYRLPNRLGFVTFGVKNLLDEDFQFQETDPAVQTIQRDRLFFTRATLAF